MASPPVWIECEQGSPEWKAARCGNVTASRFADVMTNGRAGQPSATARSYMMELIAENLTGKPSDEISAKQMEWGKQYEAEARAAYTWKTGHGIDQVGFAMHGEMPYVGASSDGLVGDDGGIEIKCPFNTTVHLKTIMGGKVPTDYVWQVQGGLWVLNRQWCDFVSYDPRMPESYRLFVLRVERDEKSIGELAAKVESFLGELATLTETFHGRMTGGDDE